MNDQTSKEKRIYENLYAYIFEEISAQYGHRKVSYSSFREVVYDRLLVKSHDETYSFFNEFHDVYNKNVKPNINWYDEPLISDKLLFVGGNIKYLPKNLVGVDGYLDLGYCDNFKELPDNLNYVNGDLKLMRTQITNLPKNLKVYGNLNLNSCKNLVELPSDIYVTHSIDLFSAVNFKILPNNLTVNGDLDLSHTDIEYLPDNLKVEDSLNLKYCQKLMEFPKNLRVNGDLIIGGNKKLYDFWSDDKTTIIDKVNNEIRSKNGEIKGEIIIKVI